jgi:hypothetical protein
MGSEPDSVELWKHLQTVVQQLVFLGLVAELSRLRDINSRLLDQRCKDFHLAIILVPDIFCLSKICIFGLNKNYGAAVISKFPVQVPATRRHGLPPPWSGAQSQSDAELDSTPSYCSERVAMRSGSRVQSNNHAAARPGARRCGGHCHGLAVTSGGGPAGTSRN